jgi:branched-chain amino acid transport system ATP-binding protein
VILSVEELSAGYGRHLQVVHGVSLSVDRGEIVALIGRNGAGKSTTLAAIAGLVKTSSGRIVVDGEPLTGPPHKRARGRVGFVMEGRSVFPSLTVRQNLQLAHVDPAAAIGMFPALEARLSVRSGLLSGGEQQMLSLARAIVRPPRALLVDEIDFGLSPVASRSLFASLRAVVASSGIGVLLVEQHIHFAEEVADRVLVMNEGRIVLELPASELSAREAEIERIYLGAAL